jgi:excinuclease ABC subunit C
VAFNRSQLQAFPKKPGVYIMKDRKAKVIYVGKAKNLHQRVRQYFVEGADTRATIPLLIARVETIDTIIVSSEKEALLLENTLIKEHQPKYNVLLKDDKSYISLKITHKHLWPMIQLVRYKGHPPKDALYFGPYTSAYAARQTLDLLNRLFPLRQCSDQELKRRDRPCILYQMKRCIAPCVGLCTKGEYDHCVKQTVKFLRGEDDDVINDLSDKMKLAAEALEFERAGEYLNLIRQIETTIEVQRVDRSGGLDTDVWGLYREAGEIIVTLLIFRHGKLRGSNHIHFTETVQEDEDILLSVFLQHYEHETELPHEILSPIQLVDAKVISEVLAEGKRRKPRCLHPLRGDKSRLLDMAQTNAKAAFRKDKDHKAIKEKSLLKLQENLDLKNYPRTIDCFDIAHMAGSDPVASLVVFRDGEASKKDYRKYKIKSAKASDDYGAMYEVLLRRYQRIKDEGDLADLLIVDGGKGQLNVALKVLKELDIISVDVISLAKEEGRHDKGMTAERVFLPDRKDPIALKRLSPILFFLQQIRDEAHRFAISFHKQRRSKGIIKTELSSVQGIGETKTKILLKHFGSVKKIREATTEQLLALKGISKRDVQSLKAHFTKQLKS